MRITESPTIMNSNKTQMSHLKKGLAALREKRYFDAHEDWEISWRHMEGDQKLFWQAMIQLAVGAYHFTNENLTGCRNLWNKALAKCTRILENGSVSDSGFVIELKDILEKCLEALARADSPLPIVEHAASNIISEQWFTLTSS
jgi:predicted metal-dependent hydrolase